MSQSARHVVATVALGVGLVLTACASKPPEAEVPQPTATAQAPVAKEGSEPATQAPATAKGREGAAQAPAPGQATGAAAPAPAQGGAIGAAAQAPAQGEALGAAVPAPAASRVPVGRTSDERRAALDQRLNESLRAFDAKLRSEQQRVAQERDARQTAVLTVAANGGADGAASSPPHQGSTGADEEGNGQSKSSDRRHGASRSAHAGDLKSDKAEGPLSGNGAVANEVPDGNDDDVVARRLRKAAEQETDPELKDKLWKEYVEYRQHTQGK